MRGIADTVVILIRHEHHSTVPEGLEIRRTFITPIVVQAQNRLDVVQLRIERDLLHVSVSHVQKLPFQRENSITLSPNHTQTRHSQALGRVTLS